LKDVFGVHICYPFQVHQGINPLADMPSPLKRAIRSAVTTMK
jgi:hypothetical protein